MIRIGTRGSHLALWQARRVREALLQIHPGIEVEITTIESHGDRSQVDASADLGVVGIFTREIERALLDNRVDVAVHSLKDMPTEPPAGLRLAAVLPRDDPRDALVAGCLAGRPQVSGVEALEIVPTGARIGTSSLRRRAELLRMRPDLEVVPVRGNVPTRVDRVLRGDLDGIVLSACGLMRLGLVPEGLALLDAEQMLPAPAQGTIAVQVRAHDEATLAIVAGLDDVHTRTCTEAERSLLRHLGGGCRVPIGALARTHGPAEDVIKLDARVLKPDGSRMLETSEEGPLRDAEEVASTAAARLRSWGARDWLANVG